MHAHALHFAISTHHHGRPSSRIDSLRRDQRTEQQAAESAHHKPFRKKNVTLTIPQIYQTYLDKSTPYVTYRWAGTGALFFLFFLRIVMAGGWYIIAYCLGIYLLNLFLAFLQPKFDPSLNQDEGLEDGESSLPTKQDQEFRPFIRRLPEFKFWHSATRAVTISFVCSWFEIFNLPVFWPVLVVYWLILFSLTSE